MGVFGFILGIDTGQKVVSPLINQISHTQIPALIADKKVFEVTKSRRNLKAYAFDRDRAITSTLCSTLFDRSPLYRICKIYEGTPCPFLTYLAHFDLFLHQLLCSFSKKKGGHLTPRKVPMIRMLHEILSRRYLSWDKGLPWVFINRYKHPQTNKPINGPFLYRKKLMRTLCRKAGVRPFGFHSIRHAGASIMENSNVPVRAIQRILGHSEQEHN
jgi:hypothetical protein